ncbi:MAG: dienelactone hydrolase family protein [Candidatus Rokubacteria bacterium]|nr:dienelactone hydrolase family protein [Candidatus Rokubacteria bacterium]
MRPRRSSPWHLLAALALAATAAGCATPVPVATLVAGETGRIAFETVTRPPAAFLQGAPDGAPHVVWGDLSLPSGGEGRLPAVILVHGSSGVGGNVRRWAWELRGLGLATFVLDSFSGRGIGETVTDQSRLSPLDMIGDAYRALALLATHPRVDAGRVALMGFSRGGTVSLYASLARFRRMHGPPGLEFAGYLAFYPFCGLKFLEGDDVSDRPIRIFHGTADDWTPIGPCREYAERLRRAGRDVELREYPGAQHAFDAPRPPGPRRLARAINPSRCAFVEREPGAVVNPATGRPPGSDDPCWTRGATVAYDPDARRRAQQAVTALLTAALGLRLPPR